MICRVNDAHKLRSITFLVVEILTKYRSVVSGWYLLIIQALALHECCFPRKFDSLVGNLLSCSLATLIVYHHLKRTPYIVWVRVSWVWRWGGDHAKDHQFFWDITKLRLCRRDMGVNPKIVVPENGWAKIRENPIRIDDLGGQPTNALAKSFSAPSRAAAGGLSSLPVFGVPSGEMSIMPHQLPQRLSKMGLAHQTSTKSKVNLTIPIGSMYGLPAFIYYKMWIIHGSYGICSSKYWGCM